MDLLNDFLAYIGTEEGERAANVILAILAALAAGALWVFGIFGKLWKALFGKPDETDKEAEPTYQIRDKAKGGFANAENGGIATGQVMGDQTIHQGAPTNHTTLSLDDFRAHLKRERDATQAELTKAHAEEKELLSKQIAELERQLADPQTAMVEAEKRIADLEARLEREANEIGADRLQEAQDALRRFDYSKADDIFAEIEARAEPDIQRAARAAFGRGEVAEQEVRWADAAAHYARAARLNPDFDALYKATDFTQLAGDYQRARSFASDCVAAARKLNASEKLALALDRQATVFQRMGQLEPAERLFREALEIDRATIGEDHPAYATRLNNLALVLQDQGRFAEAEALYRQALEITRATLGDAHPNYAIRLGNLGQLLGEQGKVEDARALLQQAMAIFQAALPSDHPYIAETQRRIDALPSAKD